MGVDYVIYSLYALKPPYEWLLERPDQKHEPLPACYAPELQRFIANRLSFQSRKLLRLILCASKLLSLAQLVGIV